MVKRFLILSCLTPIILGLCVAFTFLYAYLEGTFSYSDFHLTYSGALNGEFKGLGHFVSCVGPPQQPYQHEMTLFRKPKPGNGIYFSLPVNLAPGTYALSKPGNPGITFWASGNIDDENGKFYVLSKSNLISGTISFSAVPHDSGESVQGTFSMSFYIDQLSDIVIIEGSFDFLSSGDSDYDCLKR